MGKEQNRRSKFDGTTLPGISTQRHEVLDRNGLGNGSLMSHVQVEPQEKKKTPKGRAKKRLTYTRRFVNVTLTGGKRKVRRHGLNYSSGAAITHASPDEPQPRNVNNAGDEKKLCGTDAQSSVMSLVFSG